MEGEVDLERFESSFPGQSPKGQLDGAKPLFKPIWVAASLGYADIVDLLAKHGADIEARDQYYGMTPYLRAAQQNMSEAMEVLIRYGADVSAKPLW